MYLSCLCLVWGFVIKMLLVGFFNLANFFLFYFLTPRGDLLQKSIVAMGYHVSFNAVDYWNKGQM